jgi:hypothetical protein
MFVRQTIVSPGLDPGILECPREGRVRPGHDEL